MRVWELGDPTMQRNRIYGGKACGILIYECGKGHYVDNDIYDHREWNIEVGRLATSPHLPTSLRISPHLPTPPRTSPHLPAPPHISP